MLQRDEGPVKAKNWALGGHSAARGGSGPAGGYSPPEDVAFADRARSDRKFLLGSATESPEIALTTECQPAFGSL